MSIPARPVASQDHEVKVMGDAAVRMKVMPESTDVDLEKLAEDIRKAVPASPECMPSSKNQLHLASRL